jgi:protein involved in polysaccharide export with SLBB domain
VYIWGAVDQPGIWEVAPETDLVELFSVARPTGFGTEEIGTETQVMVRIRRTENGQTQVAHEMQLETLLNQAPNQRPSLQAGDVIEVRTVESRKLSIRTVGTIVGTLSSVTILILRLARVGG